MSVDAYRGPQFSAKPLKRGDLSHCPYEQFTRWYIDAEAATKTYANTVTLATCGADMQPTARTVLLKGFDEQGFQFYTNYLSRKGTQLLENPKASICIFWEELERQVIVLGQVHKMTGAESDQYFATRSRGSQIGAHVSQQSALIENRGTLESEAKKLDAQYNDSAIPRPDNWGGFRLEAHSIEFWQGQPDRLHDRFIYEKQPGQWTLSRYAP